MKQSERIINKLKEAFLPQNLECDGGACMGCWKDVVREAIKMLEEEHQTAIEFTKWKDKNYVQHGDKYISPYFYFREVDINDPVHKHHLRTLDQLYEEWENGNG